MVYMVRFTRNGLNANENRYCIPCILCKPLFITFRKKGVCGGNSSTVQTPLPVYKYTAPFSAATPCKQSTYSNCSPVNHPVYKFTETRFKELTYAFPLLFAGHIKSTYPPGYMVYRLRDTTIHPKLIVYMVYWYTSFSSPISHFNSSR